MNKTTERIIVVVSVALVWSLVVTLKSKQDASRLSSGGSGGSGGSGPVCHRWILDRFTDVNGLKLVQQQIRIQKGDMLVRVHALGLNFADIFCCMGVYDKANEYVKGKKKEDSSYTFCPGIEFAGDVLEDCDPFKKGDRVFGCTLFEGFSTLISVSPSHAFKVPEDWSYNQAAGFMVSHLTAYYGLKLGNVTKGSSVLLHSASGGVGSAAIKICEALMCKRIIGLVSSEKKKVWLKEKHPQMDVIIRNKKTYKQCLSEFPTFDCVLDSLGGFYFTTAMNRLSKQGRIVHMGATSSYGSAKGVFKWIHLINGYMKRPLVDPGELLKHNRGVLGFNLIHLLDDISVLKKYASDLLDLNLPAETPEHIYPFHELPQAITFLQKGNNRGKVVVEVN